jgi:outer membrane lipoprotein-sorting protein
VTALRVLLLKSMMWANELSKLAITGLAVCVCAAGQSVPATNDAAQAQLSSIVQHLERTQSQNRAGNPYVVTREYRLMDTRSSRVSSRVVAQVQYFPPDQKAYIIEDRTGSGRGEQVVKRILDHESEMSRRTSQASAAALNEENYNFSYAGTDTVDGNQCHVLGLQPKRHETELIVGQAWVDKNTFQVRRIEGDVAKTPSWMLKKVHVRLDFADVSGNWLQTGMEAVADVRFVGSQTLQSKTLDYRVTSEVAAKAPPRRSPQIRRSIPAELLFRPGSSPR